MVSIPKMGSEYRQCCGNIKFNQYYIHILFQFSIATIKLSCENEKKIETISFKIVRNRTKTLPNG